MKSPLKIIQEVSKEMGVPVTDILGRRKNAWVYKARQEVYRRMYGAGMSYPDIGKVIGRHHTTVMNALRKK